MMLQLFRYPKTAAFHAVEHAVDLAAMPYSEIDRPAGSIVAEHRGGGAAINLDPAVGMWVGQVGAGETVGLGHRESVLEHHDIADAEAVAGVGATDGDPDIARSVALLHGYPWAFLHRSSTE